MFTDEKNLYSRICEIFKVHKNTQEFSDMNRSDLENPGELEI